MQVPAQLPHIPAMPRRSENVVRAAHLELGCSGGGLGLRCRHAGLCCCQLLAKGAQLRLQLGGTRTLRPKFGAGLDGSSLGRLRGQGGCFTARPAAGRAAEVLLQQQGQGPDGTTSRRLPTCSFLVASSRLRLVAARDSSTCALALAAAALKRAASLAASASVALALAAACCARDTCSARSSGQSVGDASRAPGHFNTVVTHKVICSADYTVLRTAGGRS
jgi:hypothetical protein